MSTKLIISEPRHRTLTVRIEADPPVPLTEDGNPDVDHKDFKLEHAAAIAAADHIGDASGNPVEYRHLFAVD